MERIGSVNRVTKETNIEVSLNLDGWGRSRINTSIPFMDHMLTSVATAGFVDLRIKAKGDTEIDDHHTVEDLGIAFGMALKIAIGKGKGIQRYGAATIPLDDALVQVVVDLSGRPFLVYQVELPKKHGLKDFDPGLVEDFFISVVNHAGMNLHVRVFYGRDVRHIFEAIFKAFGMALDQATKKDRRIKGVQSVKGMY